jgi:FkbM family methyltransferase
MHYDFIEIGTSDFRTLIQTCKDNEIGLSVEPIKMYLDNLPDKPNVTKVNCAISNVNSTIEVFYVKPEDIIKHNLPNWVRGCNAINKPHPTVLNLLGNKHDLIITKETVKVINWFTLIEMYNIESITYLKIDTEGHDGLILDDYYNTCLNNRKLLANTIIFENNVLADIELNNNVINKFLNLGYKGEKIGDDYKLTKNK